MNRKTSRRSVWLFWATLLVVSLACMPGTSTPIPAAPTPAPFTPIPVTPDETTKDELFLGLATPTLATGIQPAPDDGPTLDDLKAELFYGGVGGGMFCDAAETPPLDALPAVAFNTRALSPSETVGLCLFGFPQGQNLHVSLHHPETGASFYEILSDPDPTLTPEGVPLVETSFWWPVGMLPGPWIFIVETEGATVETEFDVPPRTAPAISLIPESGVDPLHRRYDYAPGEMLLVRGAGFTPGALVPVGLYRETVETRTDETGFYGAIAVLITKQQVAADASGAFRLPLPLSASYEPGSYTVLAVTQPDQNAIYDAGPYRKFQISD